MSTEDTITSDAMQGDDWHKRKVDPDRAYSCVKDYVPTRPMTYEETRQWKANDASYLATFGKVERNIEMLLNEVDMTPTGSYPPTNIIRTSSGYRIEIAVAGFYEGDITVSVEGNKVLMVAGSNTQPPLPGSDIIVVQGISKKKFLRTFGLAAGIEVIDAVMKDGILSINLTRPIPEPTVKTIPINKKPEYLTERTYSPTYVPPNTGITGVTYKANSDWLMSHAAHLTASPVAVPTSRISEGELASAVAPGVDITVKHT